MSYKNSSRMFQAAALFNWATALGLFFIPGPLLELFAISHIPGQTLWIQLFAGLVFVFGIGYWQASVDLEKMAPTIRLAVWGKWGVVLITLLNVITAEVSWELLLPASADGAFALLFTRALKKLPLTRAE